MTENLVLVPVQPPYTTTVIDGVTYVLMQPEVLRKALSSPAVEAEPVADASLPEHAKWCQPGDRQDKRHFLVRFDDPDCRDSVFTDEDEARKFYARATLSWNCWLFGALPAHPSSPVSAEVTEADDSEVRRRYKAIANKLAAEGGGTWAAYMMIEIDEYVALAALNGGRENG